MLRLGSYGLTIDGPIGHAWYKFLDKYVYPNDPQCTPAVLIKTAADQIAWAPIMTCVYFAFLRTLEGHPELIMSTIQVQILHACWSASFCFQEMTWPLVLVRSSVLLARMLRCCLYCIIVHQKAVC